MKSDKFIAIAACLGLLASISNHTNAIESVKHLSTIEEPIPIERKEPRYPKKAAREGREGWVRLNVVIDDNGNVSNIITKETSGSIDFTKSAIKAVKKWKYNPAINKQNNNNVISRSTSVQFDFKMGSNSEDRISRKFRSQFKQAKKALVEKDFPKLEKTLAIMQKNKYQYLSESTLLQLLLAEYAKERGMESKQLKHLSNISIVENDEESFNLSILLQRFKLQVSLNRFQDAFDTYNSLIKIDSEQVNRPELLNIIKAIDKKIDSEEYIVSKAEIEDTHWYTKLSRNKFSVIDIKGALHTLDVRCANSTEQYTVSEDVTFTIPDSWGQCTVFVFGDQGAQFELVELPSKNVTTKT